MHQLQRSCYSCHGRRRQPRRRAPATRRATAYAGPRPRDPPRTSMLQPHDARGWAGGSSGSRPAPGAREPFAARRPPPPRGGGGSCLAVPPPSGGDGGRPGESACGRAAVGDSFEGCRLALPVSLLLPRRDRRPAPAGVRDSGCHLRCVLASPPGISSWDLLLRLASPPGISSWHLLLASPPGISSWHLLVSWSRPGRPAGAASRRCNLPAGQRCCCRPAVLLHDDAADCAADRA